MPDCHPEYPLEPLARDRYVQNSNISWFSTDFGGVLNKPPRQVYSPKNAQEVSQILQYASQSGARVVVRGKGHSTDGQSLVQSGLVICTERLVFDQVIKLEHNQRLVTVGAGTKWKDVVETLVQKNFHVPVLPDFLGMSVGGTLSGAGIGKGSHRYGTQLDLVEEFTIVTGAGEINRCSYESHRDLFCGALGGLGQFGLIVEATIRIEPVKPFVIQYGAFYLNSQLDTLLADLIDAAQKENLLSIIAINFQPQGCADRMWMLLKSQWASKEHGFEEAMVIAKNSFQDHIRKGGQVILVSTESNSDNPRSGTITYSSFVNNMEKLPKYKERYAPDMNAGERPTDVNSKSTYQPWFDAFLPRSKVVDFLKHFDFANLSEIDEVFLLPIKATYRDTSCSLFQYPEHTAQGDLFINVGLFPATSDPISTKKALSRNRNLLELALSYGGKNFVIDNIQDADHWRAHLGAHSIKRLSQLKINFDPFSILGGEIPIPFSNKNMVG